MTRPKRNSDAWLVEERAASAKILRDIADRLDRDEGARIVSYETITRRMAHTVSIDFIASIEGGIVELTMRRIAP